MRKIIPLLLSAVALQCCSGDFHAEISTDAVSVIAKTDTPAVKLDTIDVLHATEWKFEDPHADLTKKQVLDLYNQDLKPRAHELRKSSISADTAFYLALKQLWPAWYGTSWDFNGYTHKPRDGQIACGYFVSTTLRDAGMILNRYDLAKLYSHAICSNICGEVQEYSLLDDAVAYIRSQPEDIYIVGLDSHVGFLIKENEEVFFVHSNYLGESTVTKELAMQSEALNGSDVYVLGSILSNTDILSKWRGTQEIKISKD